MTRRRNLERHRHSLVEIREILNSMKILAYMETRKLIRCLDAQRAMVASIKEVAADFLSFYPETLPAQEAVMPLYLLIGTERGFCGNFNRALLAHLEAVLQAHPSDSPRLIAVGRKLHTLLEGDARVAAVINGASVVEEVTTLLGEVVNELTMLLDRQDVLTVFCIYHKGEDDIVLQQLLPPFRDLQHGPQPFPYPPLLNQSPRRFLTDLTDHHLLAALHEMLYTSLMVENRRRLTHLEGAVNHLDNESAQLARQCNALRQEEIIEEIEVILLSATGSDENPR